MNPGAGDQFFPYEYPQYPPGWIYPLPGPYMFNAGINPIFFAPCIFVSREQEDSGQMEYLLVQLWAEKHDQLERRESQGAHSMVLCFLSGHIFFN